MDWLKTLMSFMPDSSGSTGSGPNGASIFNTGVGSLNYQSPSTDYFPGGTAQQAVDVLGGYGNTPVTASPGNNGMLGNWTMSDLSSLGQGAVNLAQLWNMFNAMGMQKDMFNFQKKMATKNYENSVKSYNTAVADRQRSRLSSGPGYESMDSYLKKNSLS